MRHLILVLNMIFVSSLCAMGQPSRAPEIQRAAVQQPPSIENQKERLVQSIAAYPDPIIEAILVVSQPNAADHPKFIASNELLAGHPPILEIVQSNPRAAHILGSAAAENPKEIWELIDKFRRSKPAPPPKANATTETKEEAQITTSHAAAKEMQRAVEEKSSDKEGEVVLQTKDATVTKSPIHEGSETAAVIADMQKKGAEEKEEIRRTTGVTLADPPGQPSAKITPQSQDQPTSPSLARPGAGKVTQINITEKTIEQHRAIFEAIEAETAS